MEKTECPICKAIFDKGGLKRHLKTVHEGIKDHKCEHCEKAFSELHHLRTHMEMVHDIMFEPTLQPKCSKCGKTFKYEAVLRKHTEKGCDPNSSVNDGGGPIYDCKLCGQILSSAWNLKCHNKRVHLQLKDNICQRCGKGFSQAHHLR